MREKWNEQMALQMLSQWIAAGKWEGTVHFRQHNSSLYEYLYRTMGLQEAFHKIGLDYNNFKRNSGKQQIHRDDTEVIEELRNIIQSEKWRGIRHLQENHSLLYRDLSRIGFVEAFNKLGLDYKQYRYTIWTKEKILKELSQVLENGEWKGSLHLKNTNSRLYNAIVRHISFTEAFRILGLNYNDYKYNRNSNSHEDTTDSARTNHNQSKATPS